MPSSPDFVSMRKLITIILIFIGQGAFATTECISVAVDSPFEGSSPKVEERWCRQWVTHGSSKYEFVFKIDRNKAKLETSFLYKLNSNDDPISVIHTSLAQGDSQSVHHSLDFFDPLPIDHQLFEKKKNHFYSMGVNEKLKTESILQELLIVADKKVQRNNIYKLEEGTFTEMLPAEKIPFRGYWWPHKGTPMASGDMAPTKVYDQLGANLYPNYRPRSTEWEKNNHALEHVSWGGHCNGWLASSILHKEPTEYLWDPYDKRVIFPSVQKGILAENSFCVDWAFYGKRYRKLGDDSEDIYPHRFHKVLIYYIKHLQKAVGMDYRTYEIVDNHSVSGYTFTIKKTAERKFRVKAELRMHDYDHNRSEATGGATPYQNTFEYYLYTDGDGNIESGKWITNSNPDFLWVPLAQKDCGRENPHIHQSVVRRIIEELPVAEEKVIEDYYIFDQWIRRRTDLKIPLPDHWGSQIEIEYESKNIGWSDKIIVEGTNYYSGESNKIQTLLKNHRTGFSLANNGFGKASELIFRFYPSSSGSSEKRYLNIKKIRFLGEPNQTRKENNE